MNVYHIDDGGSHWVTAENEEDAVDVVRESLSMSRDEYLEEILGGEDPYVARLQPHDTVTINDISRPLREPGIPDELLERGSYSVKFSAENVAKYYPRGLVCTSEY